MCLRSRLRPLRLALNGSTRLVDGRKCSVQNPASAVFAFRLCSHGAPGDGSRSTFRRFRVSPLLARRPRRRVSLQLPPSSRFAFARAARATTPASKQAAASKQTNKHASNSSCMQTYQQPSTDPKSHPDAYYVVRGGGRTKAKTMNFRKNLKSATTPAIFIDFLDFFHGVLPDLKTISDFICFVFVRPPVRPSMKSLIFPVFVFLLFFRLRFGRRSSFFCSFRASFVFFFVFSRLASAGAAVSPTVLASASAVLAFCLRARGAEARAVGEAARTKAKRENTKKKTNETRNEQKNDERRPKRKRKRSRKTKNDKNQ